METQKKHLAQPPGAFVNCFCPLQGRITCQLRSSITCMLLRKVLLVPSYAKADAGDADVQTLMSIGKQCSGPGGCPCYVQLTTGKPFIQTYLQLSALQMLIGSST
jgi:hypothetical protein